MSNSYRHSLGSQPSVSVATVPMSARIAAPVCSTAPPTHPAVYPVMPNTYGMLPSQHQQRIGQHFCSNTNAQSRFPFVAAIPPVPNIYVPMSPVPSGLSSTVPDPTKLLEEQRKLEKERNFHMQQERLKQFTVAGKKGNISAENLIDSMFGKLQQKKTSVNLTPVSTVNNCEAKEENTSEISVPFNESSNFKSSLVSPLENSTHKLELVKSNSASIGSKKDPKELDSMMLACSNLNAPAKASNIFRPHKKEIVSLFKNETKFKESEKARDWQNIKGLADVFVAPKPRFPIWCQKNCVPDLYKTIEAAVTKNNQHPPDTNLLFPVLMASGLSRESLGHLWELVNESASGQLTIEEMYAMLALIAVAQAGYCIKSTDILHQFSACPVPSLSLATTSPASIEPCESSSNVYSTEKYSSSGTSSIPSSNQFSNHAVIRPTAILLSNSSQTKEGVNDVVEDVETWNPFAGKTTDDDFDEFKSATPTAVNFCINTPTSTVSVLEDDFDDFKQAPCVPESDSKAFLSENVLKSDNFSKHLHPTASGDILSPEDKYSVFRSLEPNNESSEWGDFSLTPAIYSIPPEISIQNDCQSVCVAENTDTFNCQKPKSVVTADAYTDDDFGDFMHANPTFVETAASPSDFADFSNFKQSDVNTSFKLDDEFGDFASSLPVHLKADNQELMFHHLKDNISLAESQSVSSLELGTFDGGGGHSGESKSSLSRQGSIPSLDLKSVGGIDVADSEECSTDIHLSPFVSRNFKSPSPSSTTKESDENETSFVGLPFQSSISLVDKYSVIRQEKGKEEDLHVSCWMRCLQSCINILQSTKKIFNQMSCSSVCNEVLSSEEGGNYIKNVTEVYKLVCRIKVTSKFLGKQTQGITDLLNEAEIVWNTICGFFADSPLMPKEEALDFSYNIVKPEPENNPKACGLCLLSINSHPKSCKQELCPSLSYGGKNYHSPCANFWVNCVDPLLPALTLPQLL